jgi:malate permease and related proteins
MFITLINIIVPVIICAALGYGWQRTGKSFDTKMVTGLVTAIATPCLIIATLSRLRIDMSVFWDMAGAAVLAIIIFFVIAGIIIRIAGHSFGTYGPVMAFANTGNLGLPLCLFAFGETGLALAIPVFAVNALCQFTIGNAISAGAFSFGQVVRTPIIYAVAVALALLVTSTTLPKFLDNTLGVLGGLAVPLMLLALGVSLASLKVRELRRSLAYAVLRIVMGLAVGIGLTEVFGLSGAARGVLIIECAMPAAVFNYLWAQHYDREPASVAGVVFVSTLMTFAALPLIITLALDPTLLPWR